MNRKSVSLVTAFVFCALLLPAQAGNRKPMCLGLEATIVGTHDTDYLYGTDGADVIAARGGTDYVYGAGGRDRICGGDGGDEYPNFPIGEQEDLRGGPGRDVLSGGADGDRLEGELGHDKLLGGPGSDSFYGEEGNDVLRGHGGEDYIAGGPGADLLHGGPSFDRVQFYSGDIRASLKSGNASGEGSDRLISISGLSGTHQGTHVFIEDNRSNLLIGGSKKDVLRGRGGSDRLGPVSGRRDLADGGIGRDEVFWSTQDDLMVDLAAEGGRLGRHSRFRLVDVEDLRAGFGDDKLIGNGRRNRILGSTGNDVLRGRGGRDALHGGLDYDRAYGGPGRDRCWSAESNSCS